MKIEITEGVPTIGTSIISEMYPWMKKRHIFVNFYDEVDDIVIGELVEDAEEAKELAQELLHCYNKLMHWAENQEEREE